MMTAFYNEIDPYAAQWLRNLIDAGHIAPGVVDERSIIDLDPDELRQYTQCHFFAGIGVWSYALRLAGVPDDRPVWTGSCPCQPFSAAGAQRGSNDERHLWPAFFRLIRECKPAAVAGEQIAGAAGLAWWDHVASDLEDAGYAAAAANIGAHSVGAPHIRQRLFFVAHRSVANADGERGRQSGRQFREAQRGPLDVVLPYGGRAGEAGLVAHAARGGTPAAEQPRLLRCSQQGSASGLMGDADDARLEGCRRPIGEHDQNGREDSQRHEWPLGFLGDAPDARLSPESQRGLHRRFSDRLGERSAVGFWSAADWIPCRDGKARPVEPGTFPLAHGATSRVGRLRAYGNAIVPQVAAEFIKAAGL